MQHQAGAEAVMAVVFMAVVFMAVVLMVAVIPDGMVVAAMVAGTEDGGAAGTVVPHGIQATGIMAGMMGEQDGGGSWAAYGTGSRLLFIRTPHIHTRLIRTCIRSLHRL